MKTFHRLNNITGWVVWLIAAITYTLTLEPTASFWDCGEFLSAAYKLQVVHPPGAAFFLLCGRIFTLGADAADVAWRVNFMNGLLSAFTILFLFWTITAIARKIVVKGEEVLSGSKLIGVLGAGAVGALCYTFSDTFWFSAVEGEVYAMSSCFTAAVVWLAFKWDYHADEADSTRYLVLIAYLMGLSAGVHLLNLLCIPAIFYVYYFRKFTPTTKGFILTGVLSVVTLGFIQVGVISMIPGLMAYFDIKFVNDMGMGRGAGVIFFSIFLILLTVGGLFFARRMKSTWYHHAFLMFGVILIAYSSTFVVVIRSQANPSIDMNDPEEPTALLSYINREQYGDRPLIKGPYFNAEGPISSKEGPKKYRWDKQMNKYVQMEGEPEYEYDPKSLVLFPRIYKRSGTQERHMVYYRNWTGIQDGRRPSYLDNLGFMFGFQLGTLWGRYFMWNFAGRQNDIQGHGHGWFDYQKQGNWISGIGVLDNILNSDVEEQHDLPPSALNNKGRNTYFFLPLIFGILGLLYHYRKSRQMFLVVGILFFFTGIAINLYLNPEPVQPRERDYVYVGSFYAFAIWVGLGVMALIDILDKKNAKPAIAALATIIGLLAVPTLMAQQNWDDHDRSGKYTARDFAISYLESCAPNAVLFTMGDNDTYPLWYAQEIEGLRTDVRVINLSLLGTDWYINQMRQGINGHPGVDMILQPEQIVQGSRDYVPYVDAAKVNNDVTIDQLNKSTLDLKKVIQFIASDNYKSYGITMPFLPTLNLSIGIDTAAAVKNGLVSERFRPYMRPEITWKLPKDNLYKNDLAMLDIIATNINKRPIYFTVSMPRDQYLGLESYFQLEGLCYRLVPIGFQSGGEMGLVEPDIMYNNMMKKFKFGNMNGKQHGPIYIDPETFRMTINLRQNFLRLAATMANMGDKKRTIEVLDRMNEEMPHPIIPIEGSIAYQEAQYYFVAGAPDKAMKYINTYFDWAGKDLEYYAKVSTSHMSDYDREIKNHNDLMNGIIGMMKQYGKTKEADLLNLKLQGWMKPFISNGILNPNAPQQPMMQ